MSAVEWFRVASDIGSDAGSDIGSDIYSASTVTTHRIVENMLRKGKSVSEVSDDVELPKEEVKHIQRLMLAKACSLEKKTCLLVDGLSTFPEEFLCSQTGKLMNDPVVDASGVSYEAGFGAAPCHPNPYLKREILAFKFSRVRRILAVAPELTSEGLKEAATRILGVAHELAQSMDSSGAALLQDVLELSVRIAEYKVGDLVRVMAERQQFEELISRFEELQVAEHMKKLARTHLTALYAQSRRSGMHIVGDEHRPIQVIVGRGLLAKLEEDFDEPTEVKWTDTNVGHEDEDGLKEETSPESKQIAHVEHGRKNDMDHENAINDNAPIAQRRLRMPEACVEERKNLLMELYELEPAPDICDQLAACIICSEPLETLQNVLASLHLPVLVSAAVYAKNVNDFPSPRVTVVLVALAQREGPTVAAELYRHVLSVDETCDSAQAGLIALLCDDLSGGKATSSAKSELVGLWLMRADFDALATHFEAVGESIPFDSMDAASLHELAVSLQVHLHSLEASRVEVLVADMLEEAGKEQEAFQSFRLAFKWNDNNELAEDGMKRLAVATGSELETAQCLLETVRRSSTEHKRISEAVELISARMKETINAVELQQSRDQPRYVTLGGFRLEKINQTFFQCESTQLNGHATYWTDDDTAFIYKGSNTNRWCVILTSSEDNMRQICKGVNRCNWYKVGLDFADPSGWHERVDGKFQPSSNGHVILPPSKLANFIVAKGG